METMTKKEMIIHEIAKRKIEKELQEYIKAECMGKTVAFAGEFILNDPKVLELWEKRSAIELKQYPPFNTPDIELSDEEVNRILDEIRLFELSKVFQSVEAEQHTYNCKHHGLNCDYILTEKDLKPSWPPPPVPKIYYRQGLASQ